MDEPGSAFSGRTTGVLAAFLMPHPPVMLPPVGRGRERSAAVSIRACRQAARRIAELNADSLILVSPHAPQYPGGIYFYGDTILSGSLGEFNAPEAALSFPADVTLRDSLVETLRSSGVPASPVSGGDAGDNLDHGALVPLWWLSEAGCHLPLVVMASPWASNDTLLDLGTLIHETSVREGRRVVLIASGDMSHRVSAASPYGMTPGGAVFDRRVTQALASSDIEALLSIPEDLREEAAECGYRSLVLAAGAVGGRSARSELLSWEAPFGIGYCTAILSPGGNGDGSSLPVALARAALESWLHNGHRPEPELIINRITGGTLPAFLEQPAGVFVSLKKHGELRGCIGTIAPTCNNAACEIIRNAISAAAEDPRFEPVDPDELHALSISVDILSLPETVISRDQLDPDQYGVIVSDGSRRGLLLPDIDGVDSVEQQLSIACRKGGIDPGGDFRIERFAVVRYH